MKLMLEYNETALDNESLRMIIKWVTMTYHP